MSTDTNNNNRQDLVHDKFINRWANRYLQIKEKYGNDAARKWGNTFLNVEDAPRILEALKDPNRAT